MSFPSLCDIKKEITIVYDKNLCLKCQQTKKECKLVENPATTILADIVSYHKIMQNEGNISDESVESLLQKGYSYHSECGKQAKKHLLRVKSKADFEASGHPTPSPKLTRSQLHSYNVNLCIICQEQKEESLHLT